MENNQDKLNEIFPAQDAGQKPENPPVEDTVVVPAIGAQAQKPEAEPVQPGETAAAEDENDDVESRGRKLLEKLDSMLYSPERHSDDVDGIDDEDPTELEVGLDARSRAV